MYIDVEAHRREDGALVPSKCYASDSYGDAPEEVADDPEVTILPGPSVPIVPSRRMCPSIKATSRI